jgi:hypothetical protein
VPICFKRIYNLKTLPYNQKGGFSDLPEQFIFFFFLKRQGKNDFFGKFPTKTSKTTKTCHRLVNRLVLKYNKKMKKVIFLTCSIFLFATCTSVPSGNAQGNRSYKVGDIGPAGGFVFYDKGENSDGWQYLEAAPPEFEFEANWNSANDMCKLLNINKFTGWRLPDRDELSFMYLNLKQKGLGGFGNYTYWSSTEERNILIMTMYHNFGNGLVFGADRLGRGLVSYKVRSIREF